MLMMTEVQKMRIVFSQGFGNMIRIAIHVTISCISRYIPRHNQRQYFTVFFFIGIQKKNYLNMNTPFTCIIVKYILLNNQNDMHFSCF